MRVVFPAALSGIVASIVLAMSRAVGETMVVLIAGGQQPQWGVDVGQVDGDAHRLHRLTAGGDVPTGSVEYKTLFAVGTHAVRDHARDQHHLDPLRAEVQAGVRVSSTADDRPAVAALAAARTSPSGWRSRVPRARHRAAGRAAGRRNRRRRSARSAGTSSTTSPRSSADKAGIQAALWGTIWLMGVCAALHRARGRGDGHLPRGVRGRESLVEPADRAEHPEPRRGPVDRLRHPRAGVPGPRAARARATSCWRAA